ncbi:apiosidase-like domain-containing protein [Aestuariimicrobium ganziense]|uniref:apiosidase-like domain-containing protein n=1 Tax=Aestuariimicrobium ganziense TaxID=2773677 RepID=UPI00194535F1|nr:DUF4038 domain-containing protein [Aestuariimicrobium ganziense]
MSQAVRPSRWSVAAGGDHLLRDGQDDFVLADTLWMSLHRTTPDQMRALAAQRAAQGFTCLMLSVLPLEHDRSGDDTTAIVGEVGQRRLDPAWVEQAEHLLQIVVDAGLTPMIMIQWVTWVPDTWASRQSEVVPFTDEESLALVDTVAGWGERFGVLWSLSGDDTFTSPASIERYQLLSERLRQHRPDDLVTLHTGGWVNLPAPLVDLVDFFGFQSGHDDANWDENPTAWNRYLAVVGPGRPRMNLEPPYEGHGYGGGRGRYTPVMVRTASWRSILSGAGAGLAYGAHGLWSWHHAGEPFSSEGWSGIPFDAQVATTFPGADDVAHLRRLVIDHQMWQLLDRSDLVARDRSGIRVGATADLSLVIVHAPEPFRFEIQLDAADYDLASHDLASRQPCTVARDVTDEGRLLVAQPDRPVDVVHVLTRR